MKKLLIAMLLAIISLSSCLSSMTFSKFHGAINYETVKEISIKTHRAEPDWEKVISNQDSIKLFVTNLNEAQIDGPWKGANWDKIILVCTDTTITLNTNGKVFGLHSSGQFFKLKSE